MIGVDADLTEQFQMQAELDTYIYEKRGIQWGSKGEEKVLALIDEICELMNKMRIHKYWSSKGMEAKDVLLDEYADIWHFLLSIGNDLEIPQKHYGIEVKNTFTQQFRAILYTSNSVSTPIGWHLTVSLVKGLGQMLKFSESEVYEAYNKKYKTNIRRQIDGY